MNLRMSNVVSLIQFLCEEGTGDYIARLDEPETCSYVLTVHTTKICHHPYLKLPSQQKPVSITCNPAVSDQVYQDYLQEEQGIGGGVCGVCVLGGGVLFSVCHFVVTVYNMTEILGSGCHPVIVILW